MNPNQIPPEDTGAMTDAEMRMAQAQHHHTVTEGLLETLVQQGEKNNPEPILEHMVVQNEELKREVQKIQEPLGTVSQFMEAFMGAVKQLKGDKGDTAEVDYEKVVAESVPKVQDALQPAIDAMPDVVAKRLAGDESFLESVRVEPKVDPAEVAHVLRQNPNFLESTKGDKGDTPKVDYAKILFDLKNDEEFLQKSKGDPGTSVVVKSRSKAPVIDSDTILKLLEGKLSYNDLKDKPTFFRRGAGGAGYLREISDVSLTNLALNDGLKWNGTRWVNAPITSGGGTWGSITGTLSAQTDLQAALDAKADASALSAYFNKSTDDTDDITEGATKKFNQTHTGDVAGATALTVQPTAISGKTLKSTLSGTEEVLINDAGTLKKTTAQDVANLASGGSPGGSNNQMQYKNGAAFAGAQVEYTKAGTDVSMSLPPQSAANTNGDNLYNKAANGKGTGVGGTYGANGGNDETNTNMGALFYLAGGDPAGVGGGAYVEGGGGAINGAPVTISGGSGATGDGGDVTLQPGSGGTNNGRINFQQAGTTNKARVNVDALTGDIDLAVRDLSGTLALTSDLSSYQELVEKNNANGYAGLENIGTSEARLWRNGGWATPEYQIDGIHRRTAPPTVTDDEANHYLENDIWIDATPTTGGVYLCTDQTTGAAVWLQIAVNSAAGGSGITRSVNHVSTDTTAGAAPSTDYVYFCSGSMILDLPTAVGNTNAYTVYRKGTSSIYIRPDGAELIFGGDTVGGATLLEVVDRYAQLTLYSDGSNWYY